MSNPHFTNMRDAHIVCYEFKREGAMNGKKDVKLTTADKQHVILITGASSGFGKAFAELFAARGYSVFGTSRSADSSVANGVTMVPMDVTDDDSVNSAVDYVFAQTGRMDVVINNAGYGIGGAIEDMTVDEARALFETNFFGVHRVCRAVIPILRAQGHGHIINIGSLGGVVSFPFQSFYSATKSALASLSDGLSMELKPFGIKVTRVEPGDYKTGFSDARIKAGKSGADSAYYQRCQRALEVMEQDERSGADSAQLASKLLRIVEMQQPGLVYREGPAWQTFAVGLAAWLPNRLVEKLLMFNYKT
jgi:short-subunit dehydrogenase